MNIQNINVIDKNTIVITTTEDEVFLIEKDKLDRPRRSWFDNILACATSLTVETPE